MLELPLLAGVSRKSMIYKVLENSTRSFEWNFCFEYDCITKGQNSASSRCKKEAVECIKLVSKLK